MVDTFSIYLASASPRRRELLSSVGVLNKVLVTDIDESRFANEEPLQYVRRLAEQKAYAALNILKEKKMQVKPILAADTIVVKDEIVFGKPQNRNDAFEIWRQLANTDHRVITSVALLAYDKLTLVCGETKVHFRSISTAQMQRYWDTSEPHDKAGAYAIQGLASAWVTHIEGSYSNVVGLPLAEVNELLTEIKLNWL